MSSIKWIKITTGIFDDEKIQLIESMPDNYAIQVAWFKLLVYAGKSNSRGMLLVNDKIPYTDDMLANVFRMPLNTVKLALATFKRFGMIEYINNSNNDECIYLCNWEKYQNIDGMEKLKLQWKEASQKYRNKNKLINHDSSYDESYDIIQQNKNKDIDKEKEIYKEKESFDATPNIPPNPPAGGSPSNEGQQELDIGKINIKLDKTPYNEILSLYHTLLPTLPKVQILSAKRRSHIKARWKANPDLAFWKDFFTKVSQSSFLTGRVESKDGRIFMSDLEWLIKEGNFIKIIEGRYDDKVKEKPEAVLTGYTKFNPKEWEVPQ